MYHQMTELNLLAFDWVGSMIPSGAKISGLHGVTLGPLSNFLSPHIGVFYCTDTEYSATGNQPIG